MSKVWWYVPGDGKVQIMIYYETNKPLHKQKSLGCKWVKKYIQSESFKQGLVAQYFLVDEGSWEQKTLFEKLGLTEKHRDHSVRKPVFRDRGEDVDEAEAV